MRSASPPIVKRRGNAGRRVEAVQEGRHLGAVAAGDGHLPFPRGGREESPIATSTPSATESAAEVGEPGRSPRRRAARDQRWRVAATSSRRWSGGRRGRCDRRAPPSAPAVPLRRTRAGVRRGSRPRDRRVARRRARRRERAWGVSADRGASWFPSFGGRSDARGRACRCLRPGYRFGSFARTNRDRRAEDALVRWRR